MDTRRVGLFHVFSYNTALTDIAGLRITWRKITVKLQLYVSLQLYQYFCNG